MTRTRKLRHAMDDLGELLGSHREGVDREAFEDYADRPVAFAREVLDEDPWSAQREVLQLLAQRDRVAWRSAQAVGKSRTIAVAALWFAYARRGQVLLSAPTRRTVEEVLMRKEIARLWHPNPRLAGDLYTGSLRIERDEPAILAFTATSSSAATGQHDPEGGVLAVLDEAQGVPQEVWVATDANTTGERDRLFVCGNPVDPSGDFWEVCRPGSGWATVQTSVFDHPNLNPEVDREIPGGPSEGWLKRMRDRWGEGSPMWRARVEGEFPDTAEDALIERRWLEAATERHRLRRPLEDHYYTLGVDAGRHGPDETVVCIRRGPYVAGFETWRGEDTQASARRVMEVVRRLHDGGRSPVQAVYVDAIGPGGGVVDKIRDDLDTSWMESGSRGYGLRTKKTKVVDFKSSNAAPDSERFLNTRAQSFWKVRKWLEEDTLHLPDDRKLLEELQAFRVQYTAKGKVQIGGKEDIKRLIGRSPDRADALAISLRPELKDPNAKRVWFV